MALIDQRHPADSAYPALVVRSEKGVLSEDELAALVRKRLAAPAG